MKLAEAPALSSELRTLTGAAHRRAEQSGVIADMLGGRVSRRAYALFLRNLLPAYQAMEIGLEKHRQTPGVGQMARQELYRANAIQVDLAALAGSGWQKSLPLLRSAAHYAACVATAANGDGLALVGHAYVRYLGDLSGGQIVKRRLATSLELSPAALTFYDFPEIGDLEAYKGSFRDALNRSTLGFGRDRVIEAAVSAFEMNVSVSESVWRAAKLIVEP